MSSQQRTAINNRLRKAEAKLDCDVPAEFKSWLELTLADCGIADRVYYNLVPQPPSPNRTCALTEPYVWFSRNNTEKELCLGDTSQLTGNPWDRGPDTQTFDVEFWSQILSRSRCWPAHYKRQRRISVSWATSGLSLFRSSTRQMTISTRGSRKATSRVVRTAPLYKSKSVRSASRRTLTKNELPLTE